MENWLIRPYDTMAVRLQGVGVEKNVAEDFAESGDNGRTMYPKWTSIRASDPGHHALLFLPCTLEETAHLYAMEHGIHGWRATDRMELDCHYDDSVSYEIGSIRDSKWDEIRVHHACVARGTGYLEQEFQILAVGGGEFKSELETNEVLHEHPAAVERPHSLDRFSTFAVVPMKGSTSRAVEETRSSTLNGQLTVERRAFRWDQIKRCYRPTAFSSVQAEP